jgi:transposase
MVNRRISADVKKAALRLYLHNVLSLDDILACCDISRATFFRAWRLWQETGEVAKRPSALRGRPRLLHTDDLRYLLTLIAARPDWFLDELLNLLKTNRFISVHYSTIYNALVRAGVSLKKLRIIAQERSEPLRADFIRRMAMYTPDQLGFLDETSKNERTLHRRRGRARRNARAAMKGKFVRGRRLSATGVMTIDGVIACDVVVGSMTRVRLLQFLEGEVVRIDCFIIP